MKLTQLVMFSGILFFTLFVPYQGVMGQAPKGSTSKPPTLDTARQIKADLKEAKEMLQQVADQQTRNRLELLLTRSELRIEELQKDLQRLSAQSNLKITSAEEIADLKKKLQSESFDSKRLSFIQSFGKERRYTAIQVRELLSTFTFDNARSDAAIELYPSVVDPENYYKALEVFTFQSGGKKVMEKLKSKK